MSNQTDMQDKYCGHSNDIHPIQSHYTKVAAVGRHHKRGAAASDRGTSFVVSFVLALNRVNVVAVTTILVLHVGVIGHHVPFHYDFMFPRRSYQHHVACHYDFMFPSPFVQCALARKGGLGLASRAGDLGRAPAPKEAPQTKSMLYAPQA